jgi:hypothetical protein
MALGTDILRLMNPVVGAPPSIDDRTSETVTGCLHEQYSLSVLFIAPSLFLLDHHVCCDLEIWREEFKRTSKDNEEHRD